MPQTLRPYQLQAKDDLRSEIRKGHKRIVLVAGTGAGKTTIAADMIEASAKKGNRNLFLCHRKELIDQASTRLQDHGVEHGIIRANDPRRRPWLNTHVASIPTLTNPKWEHIQADFIVLDECHHSRSKTWQTIINRYPNAIIIGLTATPIRSDGKGLGHIFTSMVKCPSILDLTEQHYLVPARTFAPSLPDLRNVGKRGIDYKEEQLAEVMDRAPLIGDMVAHWHKHCKDRITVGFAVNIAHSKHCVERFKASGVAAEHLDGSTPDRERDAILQRWRSRQTLIVWNCNICTEGFDHPEISCEIDGKPTCSIGLYRQMRGRPIRTADGKVDAIILDHSGNTLQHGLIYDEPNWKLDFDAPLGKRGKRKDDGPSVRLCMNCYFTFPSALIVCPECGWTPEIKAVKEGKGELVEVPLGEKLGASLEMVARFKDWVEDARIRGYRWGWPLVQFREKYSIDPPRVLVQMAKNQLGGW